LMSPSMVKLPYGKTTKARLHNHKTHWLVRRPSSTSTKSGTSSRSTWNREQSCCGTCLRIGW
jgi:hypothetical protein